MVTDKLVPYWVRLRTKNKPGVAVDESEYFDLTSLPDPNGGFENYDTFLELLLNRLHTLRDQGYVDEDIEKSLTIRQLESSDTGEHSTVTVEGVFGYGKFGRSADHLNIEKLQDALPPSDARNPNARDQSTAEVRRLYFLFHIPQEKQSRGVLILHAWGQSGIKGMFYRALQQPLLEDYIESPSDEDNGISFSMNPIASKDLVQRLTEVNIHGFELVKRNTPTSAYGSSSSILGNVRDAKARFTIDTDLDISLDEERAKTLVSKIQDSDYPYAEIFPSEVDTKNIDSVKAHINADGSNKLDLEQDRVRMKRAINEDIEYDEETYRPKLHTIGEVAREFANEQLEEYDLEKLETDSLLE
ncbi:hypothetical protein [Halodesulfurarchaeum formicicum]|uniref:Uncharacterized protein n=1 Tax=Halodesulfurarchaeum formicicum TaxID=1873524 RepID=A0A1J1AE72_9EURY|nr:hypothetical protein [Halodesulfurarchaeum formicicum]APE96444.1 hypothetical protein HSR6_2013 [Halodesulfurarchaeum formicicum]